MSPRHFKFTVNDACCLFSLWELYNFVGKYKSLTCFPFALAPVSQSTYCSGGKTISFPCIAIGSKRLWDISRFCRENCTLSTWSVLRFYAIWQMFLTNAVNMEAENATYWLALLLLFCLFIYFSFLASLQNDWAAQVWRVSGWMGKQAGWVDIRG